MSLINDALKRAKQTQPRPGPPPGSGPMRPVEPPRPGKEPRSLLVPIVGAALLVLVGGILIVLALSWGFRLQPAAPVVNPAPAASVAVTPQTSQAAPVAGTVHAAETVVAASLPSPPSASIQSNALPATTVVVPVVTQAVAVVESSNAAPVVAPPPEPVLPRLQGILFNPSRPTAFLNGRSVVVGGRVGEYTVLAITKQSVTIERAGQTNVLTMEEP